MTPRGVVRVIEFRRELLDATGTSAEAFPVPHPSWHGYVSEMRACIADLRWALAVTEAGTWSNPHASTTEPGHMDQRGS